jgi:hypothetical protein
MSQGTEISKALSLVDEGLGTLVDRQLVSAAEVTDLLLDLRALLAAMDTTPEPVRA